jgi:hypothetical protein
MKTFSERVKAFNRGLHLDAVLPKGVTVLNPFKESALAVRISETFYDKYYNDNIQRHLILGINPGRFGAALSGVPFTDFKRLEQYCGIDAGGARAHEPSSEFVYAMITAFGGVEAFYSRFYINSICPLGFVIDKGRGGVNYNYYDDPALYEAVRPFIVQSICDQISLGCSTDLCYCLGIKNVQYLNVLNKEHGFFKEIVTLPHPRFIVQYKRKEFDLYIEEYISKLSMAQ